MAQRRTTTTRAPRAPKPPTAAQRQTKATAQLLHALGGSDKVAALAVALEALNERLEWDTQLQQNLHKKYETLAALNAPKAPKVPKEVGTAPVIRNPSALVGHNPLAKLNPYELDAAYEHDQLRRALAPYGLKSLQEAVDVVLAHNPNMKSPSRSAKQKMIDFIVEQVAGPGY